LENSGAPRRQPKVVYVMGAGRSGSTTLGLTLGNCSNIFYAGELDNWLVRSGRPQVTDGGREQFWIRVGDELGDADSAAKLFGNRAQRAIERSLSLFRVHEWRSRHRLSKRYRAVAEDLLGAVARAAGVTHVVDTAHYPLRARELQRLGNIDLYLVLLVRDPQSVVASFNRQDVGEFAKSTFHSNVYLWLTHVLSVFVFLRHPRDRRLVVRYEDFVAEPSAITRQILDCCDSSAALPDFTALRTGFPLQGNRVSRSEVVSLKRTADPLLRPSRITAVLQFPVMAVLARLRPSARLSVSRRRAPGREPPRRESA
jgi:Sulfotransferase family